MGFTAAIVVPTVREDCIAAFLAAWTEEFRDHIVIVVEDNPERSFDVSGARVEHYSWKEIDAELGEAAWIIPRRTDCIRSYGYWKAYQKKPDLIVTLDDDCFPLPAEKGFLQVHWKRLNSAARTCAWVETLEGITPRGVPYFNRERQRPCILNHGLWEGVRDFDAPTQLLQARYPGQSSWRSMVLPVGSYFPMCGMNMSFKPEAVPALYFLLMGRDYVFDRFGDIWCGIIFKKVADHLSYGVTSGDPAVKHLRASNLWSNLRKETPGLEVNETFWLAVDAIRLGGSSFGECYREVANGLALDGDYWKKLRNAMLTWSGLFRC